MVLKVFLEQREANVRARLSGADVMRQTGIIAGTMYPLLWRLEEEGLLESEWESRQPADLGRPRRRLYRLTGAGMRMAHEALRGLGIHPAAKPQEA